jgi:hypothetical protein
MVTHSGGLFPENAIENAERRISQAGKAVRSLKRAMIFLSVSIVGGVKVGE